MKILAIHNFHRKGSASGDDQVFKVETALLESHGHEVTRYSVSNDDFDNASSINKALATFGMLWSFKNYRAVKSIIKKESPDIVHVHTFFPLLSPSILYAAKDAGVPVVATLHDTRFICPCATSLRGTSLCNECGDGHYLRMAKYGCFKGSKAQSLIVAFIFKYHRKRKSFYKKIDKYICLNENQISLLKSIGFDERKIVKKYNFVTDAEANITAVKSTLAGPNLSSFKDGSEASLPQTANNISCEPLLQSDESVTENPLLQSQNVQLQHKDKKQGLPEKYVVFYGRIGEEKGIRILEKIWDRLPSIPLVVMGGGPLEDEFKAWASDKENVLFLGYTQHEKCLSIVKGSQFVVFPSIWYEGCSMVEIEAMSLGRGLVATDLGFSVEAIENGFNGFKVPLGDVDGFVNQIQALWNDPDKCGEIGANARKDYEAKYLPEDNYSQLVEIYESVIEH